MAPRGGLREGILLLAFGVFVLMCYDAANPCRRGMIGYNEHTVALGNQRIISVYGDSPAQHAGMRVGDVFRLSDLSPEERLQFYYRRAGELLTVPAMRDGRRVRFEIRAAPYERVRPLEEGTLAIIAIVVFLATSLLLAIRGRNGRAAQALALFFASQGATIALNWLGDVAPTARIAFAAAILGALFTSLSLYLLLRFVAASLPIPAWLKTTMVHSALPLSALALLCLQWSTAKDVYGALTLGRLGHVPLANAAAAICGILGALLILVATIPGGPANSTNRSRTRWVRYALIVSTVASLVLPVNALINGNEIPGVRLVGFAQDAPLLVVAYAVLRYRLVAVSFLINRAAVFSLIGALLAGHLLRRRLALRYVFRAFAPADFDGFRRGRGHHAGPARGIRTARCICGSFALARAFAGDAAAERAARRHSSRRERRRQNDRRRLRSHWPSIGGILRGRGRRRLHARNVRGLGIGHGVASVRRRRHRSTGARRKRRASERGTLRGAGRAGRPYTAGARRSGRVRTPRRRDGALRRACRWRRHRSG